jgi:hypothetical protein
MISIFSSLFVVEASLKVAEPETTSGLAPKGSTEDQVQPLPAGFKEAKGNIKPDLPYLLAAPIRDRDNKIWGVIDFDASNENGKMLLRNEFSNTIIMRLATQLSAVLC